MEWLLIFGVFVIITLLGHGVWILVATICRALFSDLSAEPIRCRRCGRVASLRDGLCPSCGRFQATTNNEEQTDLAAVARQLRRWQSRGAIKPRTAERMLVRLDAYRASLSEPPKRPPQTATQPVIAELAELVEPIDPIRIQLRTDRPPIARPTVRPATQPAARPTASVPSIPTVATPVARQEAPLPALTPRQPKRTWGETLAGFMEERNIRWGELAGGLLIVCSSVALVINLWERLEAIPYFQFFIFVAVSAALFGIGLYTEHRWKLASTSRGVLIIATLLVPLNFVAMVATRRPGFDPLALATELTALGVFVALVYRAGRVIVGQWTAWLTLAVVGNSAALLLLIDRPSPAWALLVGSIGTVLEVVALGAALLRTSREKAWNAALTGRLFILTGIAGFALLTTLGMTAVRSEDPWFAVHCLSPLLSAAGVSVLICGLAAMKALAADDDQAVMRTAGTAVALIGGVVMLAALSLAWPLPASLIAVGIFNFVSLAAIALRARLRPLHAMAAASLALAYVLACHAAMGEIAFGAADGLLLLRLLCHGQTGAWLVGLFVLYAAMAEMLHRWSRPDDAAYYRGACGTSAVASLALVTWPVLTSGGDHALRAALVCAACGLGGFVINVRLRQRLIGHLSNGLLYGAALFGTTHWLIGQLWVAHNPLQLLNRPSLQAYAAACAALSLGLMVLRIVARRLTPMAPIATDVSPIDRTVLRLTTAASLILAIWQALPGVIAERVGGPLSSAAWAFDTTFGWYLLAVAGIGLVVALWDEWCDGDLRAAILLSINAAVLAAVPASPDWATASALRWALAIVFGSSAVLFWFRGQLEHYCHRIGCRLQLSLAAASAAQQLWLALAAAPVVLASIVTAAMRMAGLRPAGPVAGTWFANLGMEISHLVPLAVIVLSLVAYAVRQASPGYAFAAGLIANLTVSGGYALTLSQVGPTEAVRLMQLATLVAAVWGIGWLLVRRSVLSLAGIEGSRLGRPLLRLQIAECSLGNLLLVFGAGGAFFAASPSLSGELHTWVAATGSPLGWLALVAAAAAGIFRARHFGERLRPELTGLAGIAGFVLAASSIEWALPATPWAYRALMLGWALYALSVVAATWWAESINAANRDSGPPLALVRGTALWVRVAGLLAVALALKTVAFEGIGDVETLWAAGAIGIASAACAAMAVWLRREGWAFTAGLGVNLAATLAACHHFTLVHRSLADEWVALWQANVIAGAVVALTWLAARRRLYLGRRLSPATSPFVSIQVGGVAVAALALVIVPAMVLLSVPDGSDPLAPHFATSAGWFAWLSAGCATAVYFHHAGRRTVDDLARCLLGVGVLAAAGATGDGAAYRVVTTVWLATALLLLVGGCTAGRWLAVVYRLSEPVGRALRATFSARALTRWIAATPVLLAIVALRGAIWDPQWGDALGARVLGGSVVLGALAVWRRQPYHLYTGGLLANVAASLFWYAQPEPLAADLVLVNALAAAGTAVVWLLWNRVFGPVGTADDRDALPPYEHAALVLAASLLGVVAGWSWLASASGEAVSMSSGLAELAVAVIGLAGMVALWDARSALARPALYAIGLSAVVLAVSLGWQGDRLVWATAPVLGGWLLVATLPAALPDTIRARLRLPSLGTATEWFAPAQTSLGMLAITLGMWSEFYFDVSSQRLAGAATTALTLAALFMMLRRANPSWSAFWRVGAFGLAVLLPAELVWALLPIDDRSIVWIHREIVLLASLMVTVIACEAVASRWSPNLPNWSVAIGRFLRLAIGAGLVLAVAILGQEVAAAPAAVNGVRAGLPIALSATLAMMATLATLIALALRYALDGERDPFGLSPRGRQAYVYAAEVLGLAICLHFRVTMPKLIPYGILENWWTLVVMLVAFCGAALSELFKRKRLEVLSEPLRRTALIAPLVPVLALGLSLVWHPTGARELLFRARMVSDETVFFMAAAFYGLEARLRRSLGLASLATIAANAGLWLLWHRLHFDFLVHPQLWLIPPALAVLVAEYLNHDRLTREQSDATRYLTLSVIYVSSTADVFISHVGRDISLPLVLVLMGLSVIGMLSGMLLRVRSFVHLGFAFLLVDLSIMVYHAAWDLGHTWVFWASGIAVGAAIIGLFAVFEKRRNEAAKLGSGS
ncbi:MAG TPA: hypothetical protein VHC22_16710 [Pirellulales bacterium]|nr:hypothetical protein [Pirellulales bacterium]